MASPAWRRLTVKAAPRILDKSSAHAHPREGRAGCAIHRQEEGWRTSFSNPLPGTTSWTLGYLPISTRPKLEATYGDCTVQAESAGPMAFDVDDEMAETGDPDEGLPQPETSWPCPASCARRGRGLGCLGGTVVTMGRRCHPIGRGQLPMNTRPWLEATQPKLLAFLSMMKNWFQNRLPTSDGLLGTGSGIERVPVAVATVNARSGLM